MTATPSPWLVIALCAGVLVLVAAPRRMCACASKRDVTRLTVGQLATDAYVRWLANHPDTHCPRTLADLRVYANATDPASALDPWMTPLSFACRDKVVIISAGEDRELGTPDDIRSDR